MPETAQQYVDRILGNLGTQDPIEILAKGPNHLRQELAKFSDDTIRRHPAPGKWSPAEIAIHLAEVEMVVSVRVRLVVGQNGIGIQGFDQDAWATRYNTADLHLSLKSFSALREANVAFYRSLTPEQWAHYGMHSERGKETARRIVELCAGHDLNHFKQLAAIAG